jgi:hypothetical protein
MTEIDIQIMFQEKMVKEYRDRDPARSYGPPINHHRKPTTWQAWSHQIEAINEDFEASFAHCHTNICVISHGLTTKVNSLTFMLHHVLDNGQIHILAFVEGHPYGKS